MNTPTLETLVSELNLETAQIEWQALERFFAAGNVIFIDSSLDLVEIAAHMAQDNHTNIEHLIQSGKIKPVSDQQAMQWQADSSTLWSIVIKPWVLVQENQRYKDQ